MKLGPVTRLDKKNTATSKKFDDDIMSQIVMSLSFFWFTANLQQFGSHIQDVSHNIALSKVLFFPKNADFKFLA